MDKESILQPQTKVTLMRVDLTKRLKYLLSKSKGVKSFLKS